MQDDLLKEAHTHFALLQFSDVLFTTTGRVWHTIFWEIRARDGGTFAKRFRRKLSGRKSIAVSLGKDK